MEKRLMALRLVLNELSVPIDVSSIEGRKVMQKAVYLAQAVGVPLNYRFNWYVMGPYSPALTEDYYKSSSEGSDHPDRTLRNDLQQRLQELKALLERPEVKDLSRPDWLELLASWHYLRVVRQLCRDQAQQMMDKAKPRLSPQGEIAERALARTGLLPAGVA